MRPGFVTMLAMMAVAAACQEPQSPPVTREVYLPDSAEQMLFGVHFFLTDGGIRRAELLSDTALMYEENTRTELRGVHTTFHTATGEQNAVLTSRTGTYHLRLGTMEARGTVVVVSADGRKLETQQLRYDPSRNEISSDSAFTLTESERITRGIGFISDPELNSIHVLQALQTSGQSVVIPKR